MSISIIKQKYNKIKFINVVFHDAIIFAFEQGVMHISARRGLLSLIPKKDRNLLRLNGWRPLVMLSLDYKILAKALDNRLKKILPQCIAKTQTGFMEDRNITDNIVNLIQIIEISKRKKFESLIMIIDFQKCFDMIDHSAIKGALRYFGVGENFISWVMLLFNEFEMCVQNTDIIHDGLSRHVVFTRAVIFLPIFTIAPDSFLQTC